MPKENYVFQGRHSLLLSSGNFQFFYCHRKQIIAKSVSLGKSISVDISCQNIDNIIHNTSVRKLNIDEVI